MNNQYQNTVIEDIDSAGNMDELLIREVERDELFEVYRKDYGEYRLGNIQYLGVSEFPGDRAGYNFLPHGCSINTDQLRQIAGIVDELNKSIDQESDSYE